MDRYGKPHPKQDQIGVTHGAFPRRSPGRLLEICGNVYRRGMVLASQEVQNPAYRPTGIFLFKRDVGCSADLLNELLLELWILVRYWIYILDVTCR